MFNLLKNNINKVKKIKIVILFINLKNYFKKNLIFKFTNVSYILNFYKKKNLIFLNSISKNYDLIQTFSNFSNSLYFKTLKK